MKAKAAPIRLDGITEIKWIHVQGNEISQTLVWPGNVHGTFIKLSKHGYPIYKEVENGASN